MLIALLVLLVAFITVYIKVDRDPWQYKDHSDFEYPNYYQTVYIKYLDNDQHIKEDKASLIPGKEELIWSNAEREFLDEDVIAWSNVECK